MNLFREILDWSEAWAPLLPLTILLYYRNKTHYLKPVRIFLWTAFALNLFLDILWKFGKDLGVSSGDFFSNNNFIYNLSSVMRLLLFAWFFIALRQQFMHRIKLILPFSFLIFVLINFIFFQDFFPQGNNFFSSRLLTTESAILLFYCMQYFIYLIIEEKNIRLVHQPGFWVVTGLSIYVASCFFIFLFWEYLSVKMRQFALGIWDIHNIAFIIFCTLIAIQFLLEHKKPSTR